MTYLSKIKNMFVLYKYKKIVNFLKNTNEIEIAHSGDKALLKSFHKAVKSSIAYNDIITNHLYFQDIKTVKDFVQHVPFIDKQSYFSSYSLKDICLKNKFDDIQLFFASSGHSGTFSFGVETGKEAIKDALNVDFLLEDRFKALSKKTLFINCLPSGVKVYTRMLPKIESSIRIDVVYSLIKKLKDEFDQFILVGEHCLIKKMIEEGFQYHVPWKDLVVNVITGGEYISESFKIYLEHLLDIDANNLDTGQVLINFGISELSASVFSENNETARIRRFAYTNKEFCNCLYRSDQKIYPNIMQYYPSKLFIEAIPKEDGQKELVISTLDPNRIIPMIRYNTHDIIDILSYEQLVNILIKFNQKSLIPTQKLPCVIAFGKYKYLTLQNKKNISPEYIKELLYIDHHIASGITGNFYLSKKDNHIDLLIQLYPGVQLTKQSIDFLYNKINEDINEDINIKTIPYKEFPFGIEYDYERKNIYMKD